MHITSALLLATATLTRLSTAAEVSSNSTKRGLIYLSQQFTEHPEDEAKLLFPDKTLTWYYNYQVSPSPQLKDAKHLHFVPMLWGNPENANDFSFSDAVLNMLRQGQNITHVMGFNEPDGSYETGGSEISPIGAAASWIRVLEPLREKGIKLVGPATTGGPDGFVWLAQFFEACAGRCNIDVLPVHWYGDFQGLASHIGEKTSAFEMYGLDFSENGTQKIWITEYALPHGDIENSNRFFNESAEYFDRLDVVERYSYFGSFRSDKSNVGPYAAMLTEKGELTDIGSLYLGEGVTGNVPDGSTMQESGAMSMISKTISDYQFLIWCVCAVAVL